MCSPRLEEVLSSNMNLGYSDLGGQLPTVKFTEGKIAAIEGFAVKFRHTGPGTGRLRDVRGDKAIKAAYDFTRKANGHQTVASWIDGRFAKKFPGYVVEVLDATGKKVHGGTLLSTVRKSYTAE